MNAILKYPGAKWSCADWIISMIPNHNVYLEPYFGSGAEFFNKKPTKYETINDIDGNVVNLFKVIRDNPNDLARLIELTPYARDEFEFILEPKAGAEINLTDNNVENARRFMVRCSQGFGSKLADRSGWKNTKQSNGPVNPDVWSKVPEHIRNTAYRLKHAQIERKPAIELIRAYNYTNCFIYADPPYLGQTRNNKRIYRNEMKEEPEHKELLEALLKHSGLVMISGYDSDLYNNLLSGWYKATMPTHSDSGAPRTEVLWMNYTPSTEQLIIE
jgi:DNA adenine methylase